MRPRRDCIHPPGSWCRGHHQRPRQPPKPRKAAKASRSLVQPVGQKRLTNVAVVRLKKMGMRFEAACYKNKVLSWRSGVEKDLDEVLQSQTVYTNVSKALIAKSTDLVRAFGTDDQQKICLEILEKGELQVAGKERESKLQSQFRDIATIVMEKTINPDTQHPYTISMIERLMHEIHFAVDPNSNSKKQALEVIRELQKHYPIKRSPMRLRLTIAGRNLPSLMDKLSGWNASIISKDESTDQISVVCEIEPGSFRDCDALVRSLQGRLDMLAVSAQVSGDANVDQHEDNEELPLQSSDDANSSKESDVTFQLGERLKKQTISTESATEGQVKQNKCSTCDAFVGDARQYREHFKTEWHKHNLKRKTRQFPPLTAEECATDMELGELQADIKEYSF